MEARPTAKVPFARLIGMGLSTKLLVDTSVQLFNPFLSIVAVGTGLDIVALGRLVALRSLMGIAVPVLGAYGDRLGYQRVMRVALLLGALGLLTMGLSRGPWSIALAMVLMGLGFATFVPLLHAYLSGHLPYGRRARGLAMVEYSWALASIVGLSLIGLLISTAGWRAGFYALAVGVLISWVLLSRLPVLSPPRRSAGEEAGRPGMDAPSEAANPTAPRESGMGRLRGFFELGDNRVSAWSTILAAGLVFFAGTHVAIVYGSWLHREYQLGAAQLGTVALLVGIAMLLGSVLVSLISDRLGKRRSVLLGSGGALVAYSLLAPLNSGLVPAVIGVMLVFFTLEFTIVSNLPLLSEQVPGQRGKVMALGTAAGMSGRTLGSLTGPWAYADYGVWGLGPVSVALAALALLVMWRFVREAGSPP